MKIIFYGGKQAGLIGLLSIKAAGHKIACVVPADETVEMAAKKLKLRVFKPKDINSKKSIDFLRKFNCDLLVCCHGRKILEKSLLELPKKGCINVHPCLFKYKGAGPIGRLLADGGKKASVGIHFMTEKIDCGKTLVEKFISIGDEKNVLEVYNILYPLYAIAIIEAIEKLEKK